jgi:hypothetical protein
MTVVYHGKEECKGYVVTATKVQQPGSNGRNGSGDGEDLSGSGGEGGDVENRKSPLTPLFQRGECSAVFGNFPACDPFRHAIRK